MKRILMILILIATGLISCSEVTENNQVTIYKIGAIYNLTGSQQGLDIPSAEGLKLAVKEMNLILLPLKKKIELVLYDGKSDTNEIKVLTDKLINDDKVIGIVGFSDTDMLMACARIAAQSQKIVITSGATSPKIPLMIPDYVFLACFGDNEQAAAGAEFAFTDKSYRKSIIVMNNEMEYTRLLAGYFQTRFTELSATVAATFKYTSSTDYQQMVTQIKGSLAGIDFIYLASGPDEAPAIIKALRSSGVNLPIIGGDGLDSPLIPQLAKGFADNIYFTTHDYLDENGSDSTTKTFLSKYKSEYLHLPENAFAGLGYDAAMLLIKSIINTNSSAASDLRQALFSMQYSGVTGSIKFGQNVYIPQKQITIMKMMNDQILFEKYLTPVKVPAP